MGTTSLATLQLFKSGVDSVEKIQSKGRLVHAALAPQITHKEQYFQHVTLAGYDAPQAVSSRTGVAPSSLKRLGSTNFPAVKYLLRAEIDWEAKRFDLYNQLASTAKDFAIKFRTLRNRLSAYYVNNAFNAAVTMYDGQTVASTAHTSASGYSTRSNRPAAGSALGVVTLEQNVQTLMQQTDPTGEFLDFDDRNIELWCGGANRALASRLTESKLIPQSAANDDNWLAGQVVARVTNYITSATAWLLRVQGEENHGFRTIEFSGLEVRDGYESNGDFDWVQGRLMIAPALLKWEGTYFDPGA